MKRSDGLWRFACGDVFWLSSKLTDTFLPQGGIGKREFTKTVLVVLQMRWLLQRSAEKLLGSSDYLLDHIMEDLMATGRIKHHATVTSYRIRSGSKGTKEEHQAYRVGHLLVSAGVRLFAMIVNDHDHPPLEPQPTAKIVVSWWQFLDVVTSPATSCNYPEL